MKRTKSLFKMPSVSCWAWLLCAAWSSSSVAFGVDTVIVEWKISNGTAGQIGFSTGYVNDVSRSLILNTQVPVWLNQSATPGGYDTTVNLRSTGATSVSGTGGLGGSVSRATDLNAIQRWSTVSQVPTGPKFAAWCNSFNSGNGNKHSFQIDWAPFTLGATINHTIDFTVPHQLQTFAYPNYYTQDQVNVVFRFRFQGTVVAGSGLAVTPLVAQPEVYMRWGGYTPGTRPGQEQPESTANLAWNIANYTTDQQTLYIRADGGSGAVVHTITVPAGSPSDPHEMTATDAVTWSPDVVLTATRAGSAAWSINFANHTWPADGQTNTWEAEIVFGDPPVYEMKWRLNIMSRLTTAKTLVIEAGAAQLEVALPASTTVNTKSVDFTYEAFATDPPALGVAGATVELLRFPTPVALSPAVNVMDIAVHDEPPETELAPQLTTLVDGSGDDTGEGDLSSGTYTWDQGGQTYFWSAPSGAYDPSATIGQPPVSTAPGGVVSGPTGEGTGSGTVDGNVGDFQAAIPSEMQSDMTTLGGDMEEVATLAEASVTNWKAAWTAIGGNAAGIGKATAWTISIPMWNSVVSHDIDLTMNFFTVIRFIALICFGFSAIRTLMKIIALLAPPTQIR